MKSTEAHQQSLLCYELMASVHNHRMHLNQLAEILPADAVDRFAQRMADLGDDEIVMLDSVAVPGVELPRYAVPIGWIDPSGARGAKGFRKRVQHLSDLVSQPT